MDPIDRAIVQLETWLDDPRKPTTPWLSGAIRIVVQELKRLRKTGG